MLLAGIYLLTKATGSDEAWVSVGFVAIIVLFGLAHGYFGPRWQRAKELSERDLKAGDTLSDEYSAVSRKLATGGKSPA